MAHALVTSNAAAYTSGREISQILESARSQVEERFLAGGAVLLSVMDVLNRLLNSLESVAKVLDDKEASDTGADLRATVEILTALPVTEENRQQALISLAHTGRDLRKHVADMQETMRYLRTFAVTVKITGAGLAEFAGFAQEILERIYSGTDEVNRFAAHLDSLEKEVKFAASFGANVSRSYADTVPAVAGALRDDAAKIAEHRKNLGVLAREVGAIARGVQSKVSSTLSALQIGDITRQRIEHVQATFSMLEDFLAGEDGARLDAGARQRLQNVVHHLTAAQINDMWINFQRDSENVVKTIASFDHDMREILKLRDQMGTESGEAGGNFMRALESSVSAAHEIVKQVDTASRQADQVSHSTIGTAAKLSEAIVNIRVVRTDIHYMALNTNLRCSRLGEEGKSINVVTAELRIFAGKLDESADAIVNGLPALEAAAGRVAPATDAAAGGLDESLTSAVGNIRSAANVMENELKVLAENGREVAAKIGLLIGKLDFQHELGDVLARCADVLKGVAGIDVADISDLAEAIAPLDRKIFKLYTMVQERNIHRDIIPASNENITAPAETAKTENDVDLFADALF
ncbi:MULTISPECIES: chemotaxis protein [unclassified Rhizobium]|uniref:chemotaxis protein n=1 Tax=unclassified Rhizobium TaxID=2613769 RepID=UPI001C829E6F|nr:MULTISPECIES: chemotaxis protein [unclassified Rhizobium]MBX5215500.1 chemotaxis protein [Rhizobium sp. NLR9a]MBX5232665.1 chemotaxis protein [Rhizobium sp. NLR4a]MBX5245298.1 chemotaxis protein [Rhizobium sp. NLR3b]MBX5269012.1 chemotaxis protein [Rhizobium sp. NLR17b]MBX5276018.1 chemotaxis protein [Rhizobium sp. NLR13a]